MAKIAIFTIAIGVAYVVFFWANNPRLTEMQVFMEVWPVMLLTIVGPIVALWVDERGRRQTNG